MTLRLRCAAVAGPDTSKREARVPLLTVPFLLVWFAHFLQALAFNLYIQLPGFLKDLGADEVAIGSVYGVMALVAILARPAVGRVMDVRGRRIMILMAGALHVCVCALYLTVHSFGVWIVIVRIVHGLAEGALFSALFTYAADIVPAPRRTEGLAVFGVSGLLPIALAGLVGDFVLVHFGYRELFELSIVFAAVAFLLSLPLGEPVVHELDLEAPGGFLRRALAPALLPLFFIGSVFATSIAAIFVFLKTFVLETGVGTVGAFLATYATTAAGLRLFFGWVPDRIGPKRALFPAMLTLVAGLAVLAAAHTRPMLAVAGVLGGLGHGFAFPILVGLVVSRARASERGSAISLFTAVFDFGVLVGGPAFGAIIRGYGYAAMYLVSAAFCLIGLALFAVWDRSPVATA